MRPMTVLAPIALWKKEGMAIAKNEEGKRWKAVEGDRHHPSCRIRAESAFRRPSHAGSRSGNPDTLAPIYRCPRY